MTETKFVVFGYDTKQERYDALGTWAADWDTAEVQLQQRYPNFEHLYVYTDND